MRVPAAVALDVIVEMTGLSVSIAGVDVASGKKSMWH